jgi:hypothetical protein
MVGQKYLSAMEYGKLCLTKEETESLIRHLAEAKELSKRMGERQTEAFFREP